MRYKQYIKDGCKIFKSKGDQLYFENQLKRRKMATPT